MKKACFYGLDRTGGGGVMFKIGMDTALILMGDILLFLAVFVKG
jgi:hypothetical protein